MPHLIINPQTRKLSELLGNSVIYKVPPFQRNYSWEEEQWDDLWTDLHNAATKQTGEHYMGYIVLQEDKDALRESKIIDGQQRLVTFSLLVMAATRCIINEKQKKELQARYLKPKHLVSDAVPVSRLQLNRTNDVFYNILLRGNDPSDMGEHKSNCQMLKALRYFEDKIKNQFSGENADNDIARFIDEQITELAIFTVLHVDNEEVAYVVFETLNARGVELSSSDLLKNHFFSVLARETSPTHLEQMESVWDNISGTLRGDITDFLRYYWMSRNGKVVRKKKLYRAIRDSLNATEKVFPFLDAMKESADIYTAMRKPAGSEWETDAKRHLESLNLYRAKQHFPLLLSAFRKWGDGKELTQLARACAVIFFRRSVCGSNSYELEGAFVSAVDLLNKNASCADLLQHLQPHYPNDEVFAANFARYICPSSANPRMGRHIMLALENGKFSGDDSDCTLEHILPQNPGDGWKEFDARKTQSYIWRIGNLALLDAKSNRQSARCSFSKKKEIYAESKYAITRDCAEYGEWTENTIDSRQRKLAKKACGIWNINF